MDTCTNCGATLRPGAKFCTACGTRLNDTMKSTSNDWSKPADNDKQDSQETQVIPRIDSEEAKPQSSGEDPASRFISALDNDVKPVSEETPPPAAEPTEPPLFKAPPRSTWSYSAESEPAETTTKPQATTTDSEEKSDPVSHETWLAPPSWSNVTPKPTNQDTEASVDPTATWGTAANEPEEAAADNPAFKTWGVPAESTETGDDSAFDSSWGTPRPTADVKDEDSEATLEAETSREVDAAGFSEGGANEVDYLSGDENIELAGTESPALSPDDARTKAIALADELRRTIRMMSNGESSDHGTAMMALTEASLHVSDFSDVRGMAAELAANPRDIHALGALAAKVDRIETLLDEHAELARAIETALGELSGDVNI